MTILKVAEEIFQTFPGTLLGLVSFHGIQNVGEDADVMTELWKEEARVIERFQGISVNEHPQIACWREAYRKFGAKPKDHPSSIENLIRRSMKGRAMRHINLLVDIYNTISLRYILPVGGEDLDKVQGNIELTFAKEGESSVQLLGEPEPRPPKPGEVIYKDDIGAICRRWNWKEAERTKFSEDTVNGFLVMEALPPVDAAVVHRAIDELSQLVEKYCGGSVQTAHIDSNNSAVTL
jgi:DNA/RNA-binding domain of Phe-tRNA-synthetase-like protein